REHQVTEMPADDLADERVWREVQPVLDEELCRLADKRRVPLVLCELEGKSRRAAARQLGWPEATLSTRLMRGRQLLARRLTRRRIARSAGPRGLVLAQGA